MHRSDLSETDLMPSAFEEGLCLWSCTDGTPDSPTYDLAPNARLAHGDRDFGTCLEVRKIDAVQPLRYTGEVPVRHGALIEIVSRLKAVRGIVPAARIAAWPGGAFGRRVPGLTCTGPVEEITAHGEITELRAVIGPQATPEVDMVWGPEVLYAHVGLDLIGPQGGAVRIESVSVRETSAALVPVRPAVQDLASIYARRHDPLAPEAGAARLAAGLELEPGTELQAD